MIDWVATGSWLQAAAGFAGAGSIIWAAVKGSERFSDWLIQKQTERKLMAAERIMTLAYKIDLEFPALRSPAQFGGETAEATKMLEESYPGYNLKSEGFRHRAVIGQVILTRLFGKHDLWKEYFECKPLVRAFFGSELDVEFSKFWQARTHILVSAQMYADTDPGINANLSSRFEADFWEGWAQASEQQDRVVVLLREALSAVEHKVLPVLRDSVDLALHKRK